MKRVVRGQSRTRLSGTQHDQEAPVFSFLTIAADLYFRCIHRNRSYRHRFHEAELLNKAGRRCPLAESNVFFRAADKAMRDRLYYEKDGHWTAEGHRLAAKVLASWMKNRKSLPVNFPLETQVKFWHMENSDRASRTAVKEAGMYLSGKTLQENQEIPYGQGVSKGP